MDMEKISVIERGNKIRIPDEILEGLGIEKNGNVIISIENRHIILKKQSLIID